MAAALTRLFGRRMRALRLRREMTQEALGKAAKLHPKFISLIERGERAPSFPAMERIVSALGVQAHELFKPERASGKARAKVEELKEDILQLNPRAMKKFFQDLNSAIRRLESSAD